MMKTNIFLYLITLLWSTLASADLSTPIIQSSYWNKVDTEIIVIGVGYDVASVAGHATLRFIDHNTGEDTLINWGLFDFTESGFIRRFIAGNLTYSVGKVDTKSMLNTYQQTEPERSIISYPLNLTADQKRKHTAKAHWWLRPENRYYQYHMWQKNCVTLLRDTLNDALDNQLHKTLTEGTNHTVRDLGQRYFSLHPPLAALTHFLFNDEVDRPLTVWDEMFLPQEFVQHLARLSAIDATGQKLEKPLLNPAKPLYPGQPLDRSPTMLPQFVIYSLGLGLILLAYWRPLILIGVTAAASGLAGLLLILSWNFSSLPATGFNFNLLIFWPTDLIISWYLCKNGKMLSLGLRYYAIARVFTIFLILIGYVAELIPQDVTISFSAVMLLAWFIYLTPATTRSKTP